MNIERLRRVLKERGISSTDIAKASGLSISTVSAVLGGYATVGSKRWEMLRHALIGLGVCDGELDKKWVRRTWVKWP